MDKNDISELRGHLFDAIKSVKSGTMDIDQARTIKQVADSIIDTAKVEVDYMRVTGATGTGFIALADDSKKPKQISQTTTGTKVVEGNVTRHILK